MNPVVAALLVAVPIAAGATLQRTTGLGLALVGAPFLVAVLGPRDGVSFGNALQSVLCTLVLAQTWRDARWASVGLLLAGAAVGVPAGALVATTLPEAPLLVVVGLLALLGVALSAVPAAGAALRGTGGAVGSGVAAGFVNATAGVGGPLISAYGVSQRIEPRVFVPTAQAVLLAVNLTALLVKGVPDLGVVTWVAGLAAITVGVLLGGPVSRRLSPVTGRRLMLAVAAVGALATVARGLLEL
ncbi:TSUP family transporter [Actinomycetospora sp. OC33-EN08]|uniref:Probable membrane transporter protein n=1 Tax=Actinomycetospora aurantiaca TaxID=3129233 RepID=A0ABU8MWC2_9PSEU